MNSKAQCVTEHSIWFGLMFQCFIRAFGAFYYFFNISYVKTKLIWDSTPCNRSMPEHMYMRFSYSAVKPNSYVLYFCPFGALLGILVLFWCAFMSFVTCHMPKSQRFRARYFARGHYQYTAVDYISTALRIAKPEF